MAQGHGDGIVDGEDLQKEELLQDPLDGESLLAPGLALLAMVEEGTDDIVRQIGADLVRVSPLAKYSKKSQGNAAPFSS